MQDRISITVDQGIADVRLIRSDKMNALDHKMFDAIVEAGEQLRSDDSIRVVVLSGEGRAFCAGLDMGIADGNLPSVATKHCADDQFILKKFIQPGQRVSGYRGFFRRHQFDDLGIKTVQMGHR